MSCLTLTLTPAATASASVAAMPGASLGVTPAGSPASLAVRTVGQPSLSVVTAPQPSLAVTPTGGASLTLGEVCTVSGGTIVVLAGSDGPFRTRDGGYFLLDPATSPATRSRSRRR